MAVRDDADALAVGNERENHLGGDGGFARAGRALDAERGIVEPAHRIDCLRGELARLVELQRRWGPGQSRRIALEQIAQRRVTTRVARPARHESQDRFAKGLVGHGLRRNQRQSIRKRLSRSDLELDQASIAIDMAFELALQPIGARDDAIGVRVELRFLIGVEAILVSHRSLDGSRGCFCANQSSETLHVVKELRLLGIQPLEVTPPPRLLGAAMKLQ